MKNNKLRGHDKAMLMAAKGHKLHAIKIIWDANNCDVFGLKEAKEYIELMMKKEGIES